MKFRFRRFSLVLLVLAFLVACGPRDETAPESGIGLDDSDGPAAMELPGEAKPLAEIVGMIERQGYGPVAEIELEDAGWEISAYKSGQRVELLVDGVSGEVIRDMPPETGAALSEILGSLEAKGYGPFLEVELTEDGWEIETHQGAMAVVLLVDVDSGEIIEEE